MPTWECEWFAALALSEVLRLMQHASQLESTSWTGYGFVHYETEEAAKQARCISLPSCFAEDLAVSDALGWLWLAEGPWRKVHFSRDQRGFFATPSRPSKRWMAWWLVVQAKERAPCDSRILALLCQNLSPQAGSWMRLMREQLTSVSSALAAWCSRFAISKRGMTRGTTRRTLRTFMCESQSGASYVLKSASSTQKNT